MDKIYFSNYQLEKNTNYFLYIGELKNYGLNLFLSEALSRIQNRKFDFISIVPDVFEQYNCENIIVINPLAEDLSCKFGQKVSCRLPATDFMTSVSENREVRNLVQKLLSRQDNLYVYMYESMLEMTLDLIPGVSILGPDSKKARKLNSKTYQYNKLKGIVPTVDFMVCDGMDELIQTTDKLWSKWRDGIFTSLEYSAAGTNSVIAYGPRDIVEKFHESSETFLISRYIPHEYDPTVLGVVASEKDVYIAGVADQRIEKGTRFTGSTFPSVLPEETLSKLKQYTRTIGKWLAGEGYTGIYGCDFLVDKNGAIFFLEINARKQGTTMEFCCTLEQSLPSGSPILPELEYYAVTEGRFPANTLEMKSNSKNLHWGTYNYKIHRNICTSGCIPQISQEREAFRKVAKGCLKKDFIILEHTGSDFIVAEGAFLARIVAIGQDHSSVQQGLEQGLKTIECTIREP